MHKAPVIHPRGVQGFWVPHADRASCFWRKGRRDGRRALVPRSGKPGWRRGRLPLPLAARTADADGGCDRSSAISRKISWHICRGMATRGTSSPGCHSTLPITYRAGCPSLDDDHGLNRSVGERCSPVPRQLQLSGGKLDQAATSCLHRAVELLRGYITI